MCSRPGPRQAVVRSLARLPIAYLRSGALYLSVLLVGLWTFLWLAPLLGYLPAGDRPQPGWYGFPHGLSWPQVWSHTCYVAGYVAFFAWPTWWFFNAAWLLQRLLEWPLRRTLLRRISGAVLGAVASSFAFLSLTWILALGEGVGGTMLVLGALGGGLGLARPVSIHPQEV